MRSGGLALTVMLAVIASGAHAEDLVAQRPGLMCVDPKGLAQLTMPDGGSKLRTGLATAADRTLAFVSQCVDIPVGARLPMGEHHRQTSQVYYEGPSGPDIYVVPNVDFSDPTPSPPSERPFAELRLHAAGFDLKVNRSLGLTCQPAEYVHGVGHVLDCKVPGPLAVVSAGIGTPTTISCAAGAVQLLPDGSFRMCRLTEAASYMDYQGKRLVCPPGRTLAQDMVGGDPDRSAFCQ